MCGFLFVVEGIEPDNQRGITETLLVLRNVSTDYAAVIKSFVQLKAEHGIMNITPNNFLRIKLSRHLVSIMMIARQATAGNDAFEVKLAT